MTGIVFIDSSVNNYEILLDHLVADIKAIVLDPNQDGVAQITQVLSQHRGVENVHIVSHGSPGTLYLGNTELSLNTLKFYTNQLKSWFSPDSYCSFSQLPALFVYGCCVAAGDAGGEFITKLHDLTGANIAASANLTGNAVLGGNWNLEVSVGKISNQLLAFAPEVITVYPSVLIAPILNDIEVILNPINNNAGQPVGSVGTPIFSIVTLGDNVIDPDSNVTGIAITGANTNNGNLFYTINNGVTWTALEPVSDNNARLLASDAITRIYFQPNASFSGTVDDILTFRAWDQTVGSGTNGGTADTIFNSGTTAFSTETDVAAITVNAVNNAPILNNANVILPAIDEEPGDPEGAVGTLISSLVSLEVGANVTDPDNNAVTGIAITGSNNTNGVWFYSINDGNSWELLGSVSNTNARLLTADPITRIYFQPSANFNGSVNPALTFRAWDQTNTLENDNNNGMIADTTVSGGATAFSSTTANAVITVNSVNDAPTLSEAEVTLTPINNNIGVPIGAVGTLVSSLVRLSDNVIDPDVNAVTGIAITNADTTNGIWFYSTDNGSNWIPLGLVSDNNARLLTANARIYFLPNSDSNGTINNILTFRAWDQNIGTNGSTADTTDPTVDVTTSAFSSATNTLTITINPGNNAPILSDTNLFLSINENPGAPVGEVGTLVSSLVRIGTNITDPDTNAVTGIAITGANTTNGSFFYSTDNGLNWSALGSVSNTNARVLAADSNTRIYFQPNPNFAGTLNDALTFRAWDQTSSTNGSIVDTTVNGGATAFSSTIDTVTITVNGVNDAPILLDTNVILTAVNNNVGAPVGAVGTLVSSLVSIGVNGNVTDSDGSTITGVAITGANTTNGSFFYSVDNGVNWVPLGAVSDANARLLAANPNTRIYFQPNSNFAGTVNDALTFRAWDQTSGINGSSADTTVNGGATAFSSAIDIAAITVNSGNNAPILSDTNLFLSINENPGAPVGEVGTLVSSLVRIGTNITDPDTNAVTGIAITGANTTNGSFFYSTDNGLNWSALGSVSNTNARVLAADSNTRIYFQPNPNFAGTLNDALTFRAWDQTSSTNGSIVDTTVNGGATAFSSTIDTVTITVNGVNDAPILLDTNVILTAVNNNVGAPVGAVGTLVSSLVSIGVNGNVTDSDGSTITGVAITGANTTNGSFFYSVDNGVNWVPLGAVSDANARLLAANPNTRIYFQPNSNFAGTVNDALTFRAWDQTSGINGSSADTTVNGGATAFSSAIDIAAITVNSGNNPDNILGNSPGNNLPVLRLGANNLFQLQSTSNSDEPKLEVTFVGRNSNRVNELGVFVVDDDQGSINGITPGSDNYAQAALSRANVIFSVIADVPNGLNTDFTRLLEFNSGARLQFFLVDNSSIDSVQAGSTSLNNVVFPNSSTQKVTDLGNGEYTLAWNDASNIGASGFQDLVVRVKATNQQLPLGAGTQGNPSGELIDLRGVSTQVKAEFVLNREAVFDNLIGFYQVTDVNGGIDTDGNGTVDLRPGDAGYAQAAVRGRIPGIDLTVSNQSTATFTANLNPGSILAPFMIANGTAEEILDGNSNNDPAVYFSFLGANPGQVDHVRLLGNNTFGFEDLANGGDRDYNDMTVRVNLSIA
ncbi:MAG: DUF4347 domain-containing protein [Scytonema sp. PMC 1069.18]|nr:DUF4347 domain-containing protein [Scytonema sp. PMC 1069.18]MEC4880349.1 DUF4347 domain-containing protein [Scytonema sp. PMC 1070.18]